MAPWSLGCRRAAIRCKPISGKFKSFPFVDEIPSEKMLNFPVSISIGQYFNILEKS
jgi:hypothetical protein